MRTAAAAAALAAVMLAVLASTQAATDTAELAATLAKVRGFEKEIDEVIAEKKAKVEAAISKSGPGCDPGYYKASLADPCTVCGVDGFCPGGNAPRKACPTGYSTAGVTVASSVDQCFVTCEAGAYAAVATGPAATCYSCGPGFYCPGGPQNGPLSSRVSCQLGFTTVVNDATGVEDCVIVCPDGQYSASKTGPCMPCGVDAYCAGGAQDIPVRVDCPPLTPFTNTTTASGPGDCVGCTAGTSFYNGTCVVECAVGFYSNSSSATSCDPCEVGFYCPGGVQGTPGRTSCAPDTTAQPMSGDSTACVPDCSPGFFYNATQGTTCQPCALNFWCPGGVALPEPCPDGTITQGTAASEPGACITCLTGTPPACTAVSCLPGFYAQAPGGPCQECGVGFTCPGGAQTSPLRAPCSGTLTTTNATASSPSECIRLCPPGEFAASPTAACQPCLSPYYCSGGSQADGPVRDPCPQSPSPGYVTLTSTATSQTDCVVSCTPGWYSEEPAGPCTECGIGSWCPGGPQPSPLKNACVNTTTTTTTASSAAECVAYECPFGLLAIVQPPLNASDCGVVQCDPCGDPTPDLYMTGKLGVYVSPNWSPATAANSASLVCSFDKYDPLLCAQTSTSARDACTTNDIAIDGAGNYYVLGRTGGSFPTSGWVIRIDPDAQAPGQPCVYEVLLTGITPYAGLGAAPNSNLLYATGSGSVLTLKIETDGSLSTAGELAVPSFTGAGDITAGPNGTVYVISEGGQAAYEVTVDGDYLPTAVQQPALATTGSTYPAAFCTSAGPLGVSSFGPFGQVSDFTTGTTTFDKVGVSGQLQASGLSGAAVAPVCSTVPVPP